MIQSTVIGECKAWAIAVDSLLNPAEKVAPLKKTSQIHHITKDSQVIAVKEMQEILFALAAGPLNTTEVALKLGRNGAVTRARLGRLKRNGQVKQKIVSEVEPAIWSLK